ncbi:C4-dicarboxylate ABC transporter [Betaproteobacteria bacterium]|nr:C4-dicarboxylate ABC transporter [Betaproteobacteria bacterium]
MKVSLKSLMLLAAVPMSMLSFHAGAAEFTLQVSTSQVADDPMYKGLLEFKKNVEARTNGRIEVKTYPAAQLGSDEDVVEQIRAGGGVALITDGARMERYVKEFGVMIAPYLVNNFAEIRKFTLTPLFGDWSKKLHDTAGFQIFSFNWYQGERNYVTNKPITKPADLAGVRTRTPGSPMWIEVARAMGATPVGMAWSEAYSALSMKAIDAVEVQMPSLWGSRLYEVTKYVAKTRHIHLVTGLIGSAAWFDKLPKDLQQIVQEESLKAGDYASQITIDSLATIEKDIQAKGMIVSEPDLKPFIEATQAVYDKFGYNDLRKQITEAIAK